MKRRRTMAALLCTALACGILAFGSLASAASQPKITVLNPLGTPPPIEVKQMAPRLKTLDGKTIYLINTGFPNSGRLLEEIGKWFKANHPKTKMVQVRAGMDNIPANVMAEIKEKSRRRDARRGALKRLCSRGSSPRN